MTSIFSKLKKRFTHTDQRTKNIDPSRIPKHIAIIMDGNGRWAQRRGLPRLAGHRAGAKAIREVVELAPRMGVKFLTLYAFSAENWSRPNDEVSGLMRLFQEMLESELDQLHRNNVRFRVIGALDEVAEPTQAEFRKAIEKTRANTGLNLIIALNYGGRADIIASVKKIAEQRLGSLENLDESGFAKTLSTAGVPDPELIIRTSGEMRLSNFLIWEGAYSEFWVTEVLWPDFSQQHLADAVYDYQRRERRFGGLRDETADAD